MILISFTLFSIFRDATDIEHHSNALLNLFISNFGQIFCCIPELIVRKILTKKKEKKSSKKKNYLKKKKESCNRIYI